MTRGVDEPFLTTPAPWPLYVDVVGPSTDRLRFVERAANPHGRFVLRGGAFELPAQTADGLWQWTDYTVAIRLDVGLVSGAAPDVELVFGGSVIDTMVGVVGASVATYSLNAIHDLSAGGDLHLRFKNGPTVSRSVSGWLALTAQSTVAYAGQLSAIEEHENPLKGGIAFVGTAIAAGAAVPWSSLGFVPGAVGLEPGTTPGEYEIPAAGNYVIWTRRGKIDSARTGIGATLPIGIWNDGSLVHTHSHTRTLASGEEEYTFRQTLTLTAGTLEVVNGDATFAADMSGRLNIRPS